ncbi:MAG: sigma-54-dependent Fis family transcriptional regulator [Proteobacteria bacterium]|nr:sigma-54-dependent Fis family transcriptional regulator [Pseudomonadota bacterium]
MNILILGNITSKCSKLINLASKFKMETFTCDSIENALDLFNTENIVCCFIGLDVNIQDYFKQINNSKINMPSVLLGEASDMQKAVTGIRMGAIEFLPFPLDEDLLTPIFESFKKESGSGPIAQDEKTLKLLDMAKKFAKSNATVLIRGESGTGKEVFSSFIHENSPRIDENFISVNCAAIPENLLESELFGHEKGSFSGALTKRIGKFEQANGGTLLLDEISEMDASLQAKLLRAIQERVIDPIGSSKPIEVDIRLIATTNRDLEQHVAEGKFREDLYFRLNVIALDLPALRERPEDIIPLSEFFAAKYAKQNGIDEKIEIASDAIEKLEQCYWKGNVRELENTIHRAIIMMSDNIIRAEDIIISPMSLQMVEANVKPEPKQAPIEKPVAKPIVNPAANAYGAIDGLSRGDNNQTIASNNIPSQMIGKTMKEVEQELIISTLNYCEGNRAHAANILGISIVALRNKLKGYEAAFGL